MENHGLAQFLAQFEPRQQFTRTCDFVGPQEAIKSAQVSLRIEYSTKSGEQRFVHAKFKLATDFVKRVWWEKDSLEEGEAPRTIPK